MAMTKDKFHAACKRHGLTVTEFAEEFGVAPQTAYQWGGRYGVPRWATRILELLDQHGAAALNCPSPRARSVSASVSAPAVSSTRTTGSSTMLSLSDSGSTPPITTPTA